MNEWLSGRLRIGRDENQVCRLEGHETEQKCVPPGENPRDGHSSKGGVCRSSREMGHLIQRNSKPVLLHGR